jgi:hypothetical protein
MAILGTAAGPNPSRGMAEENDDDERPGCLNRRKVSAPDSVLGFAILVGLGVVITGWMLLRRRP